MALQRINIHDFRLIRSAELLPSPHFNFIFGENASGKTSILESIYVLSTARSFRSVLLKDVIRSEQAFFQVSGAITPKTGTSITLGLEKSKTGLLMKAGGRKLNRVSELASYLPVKIIHPESHALVSGGAKQRRQFLNWGVFHVEPAFLGTWNRYERALKQRNAALKNPYMQEIDRVWDSELSETAQLIHRHRQEYIESLCAILPEFTGRICGSNDYTIEYRPGWDIKMSLLEALSQGFARDRQRGFTCLGPHRADLIFKVADRPVQEYISRGQQKMLVSALSLAQAKLFALKNKSSCIVLLDDIGAELDRNHQERLLEMLTHMQAQVFITAIDSSSVPVSIASNNKMFHVERGHVQEVV